MDGTDYNRPRRPNADTLTYLKSLPFDERVAHDEIDDYINYQKQVTEQPDAEIEEVEYPQALSAALAALDEIKHEIASLAGDEFGSQCIETIARITAPYSTNAARKLLHGVSGYMIHLSTHRYASHAVQTILQNVQQIHDSGDSKVDIAKILEIEEEDEQEDGYQLPELKDSILSISQEIQPVSKDLAVHICGSHVLRSMLCILGGCVEVVPDHLANKPGGTMESGGTRRGKVKSKKKKKKNKSVMTADGVSNNASHAQYKKVENGRLDATDDGVKDCLYSFIYELTQLDLKSDEDEVSQQPGELQQLASNPSAGPLLIVLLHILIQTSESSVSTAGKEEPETDQDKANKSISDFRLGIHAPPTQFSKGSPAEKLAKCLLCWDDSTEDGKQQEKAGDIVYGLSGETRGSHVVETLLRTSNDSFYESFCNAGKFFEPEAFADYAHHDVSNFIVQMVLNTARTREQVECLIKCVEGLINDGYVLDAKNRRRGIFWRAVEMSAKFRIGQETILKCMRKGFGTLKSDGSPGVDECVHQLINFRQPEEGKRFAELDAIGARTVYQLLRFVPRLCGDSLSGIVAKYDAAELESMCNDGLASRCLIDGILDGPTAQKPFSQAVKKLFEKLKGRWASLSVERVGHHTVKKIFIKLTSMDDRKALSEELADGINRLNGNAMGRSVIADCAVKDLMEGEDVWNAAVKKRLEREIFLKEIVEGNFGTEKKRKRKRKKAPLDADVEDKKVKS